MLRPVVVIEVEAYEGLIEELYVTCSLLSNRKSLHQDVHGVLEALPHRVQFLEALLQLVREVGTVHFEQAHTFALVAFTGGSTAGLATAETCIVVG